MTEHPGLERLRAFTAGELTGEPARRTAQHVAACADCADTASWLDAVRGAARAPAPEPAAENWDRITERLDAGDVILLPADPARSGALVGTRALRVAGVALLLAGGAFAALPNGWLRTWVGEALHSGVPAPAESANEAAAPAAESASVSLLVEPHAGAGLVSLEQPAATVVVRVQLADGTDVEVSASGAAAAARFQTAPGRLTIADASGGEIVLAIPHTLARVRFEVDDQPYLIRERGQIRILAPVADTAGSEFILQVRARTADDSGK